MRARARNRVEKSNWQLTWQQTNDKRLSVCLSVCRPHCPSVPLSDCVHSICRVRFRFRVRIVSNELRRSFKNCKLREQGKGQRAGVGQEIGKLYNNLAGENFCCSMSLANCLLDKTLWSPTSSSSVAESIRKYLKDTLNYAVVVWRCQHLFLANAVINWDNKFKLISCGSNWGQ